MQFTEISRDVYRYLKIIIERRKERGRKREREREREIEKKRERERGRECEKKRLMKDIVEIRDKLRDYERASAVVMREKESKLIIKCIPC